MKIAVLSDIHGNLDALGAVLTDIKEQEINKFFICGDLAMAGPEPAETMDFILDFTRNNDVEIVQGNTDEMIVKSTGEDKYTPPNKIMAEALKYSQKVLNSEHKEYLMELPDHISLKLGKLDILIVHGSPRKNNEDILPCMNMDKLREMLANTDENVILCGHTHLPVIYHVDKKVVINAGSVGRPFTEYPKACYAIIDYPDNENTDFYVNHRFVDYDYKQAAEKLSKQPFEGSDKLADMLIRATSRYPE